MKHTLWGMVLLMVWSCGSRKQLLEAQKELAYYKEQVAHLKNDSIEFASQNNELILMVNTEQKTREENSEEAKQLQQLKETLAKQSRQLLTLRQHIQVSLEEFVAEDLFIQVKSGRVYISMKEVAFKTGSTNISNKGEHILNSLGKVLTHHQDINILVEGHTDSVPVRNGKGFYKDNWDLSTARAAAVARILAQGNGIHPERMAIVGRAEFSPVASNQTLEGRKKNRRIEIVLSPKGNDSAISEKLIEMDMMSSHSDFNKYNSSSYSILIDPRSLGN